MKKIITLSLFFCQLYYYAIAQTLSSNGLISLPPTPQSSSLFKFVETPVAEFSGLPNVNIPIYTIGLKSLNLPISIKYHSSGNKLQEQSGNLGLGWALEAGGTITSTVFGLPDFVHPPSIFPQDRMLNPQKTLVSVGNYQENADYTLLMGLMGNPIVTNTSNTTSQVYDTKPDMFYYSMFNRAGKFFYTNDGFAHTIPSSKMLIQRSNGYTITDELGIRYVYSEMEQTVTSTITFGPTGWGGGAPSVTNYSYHLSSIITPANDTLSFSYRTDTYSYSNTPSHTRYRTLPSQSGCVGEDIETTTQTTTSVVGKFLTAITSNRGHNVQFIYNTQQRLDLPGTYALKRIDIYEGNHLRSVGFENEYFGQNELGIPTQPSSNAVKLKLKHVSDATNGNHSFEYYDEYGSYPARDGNAIDHWGYYNASGGLFPADPQFGYPFGANKNPDFASTVKGVLKRVIYPTKGFTDFEYEQNQFLDTVSTTQNVFNGASIYYEGYDPSPISRTVSFTIPPSVDPNSIQVTYECTDGTYDPQFSVQLYNADYSVNRSFAGIRSTAEFINLSPGTYTISLYQFGTFDAGYFNILWSESMSGTPTVTNSLSGGLRIKKVKDYSEPGQLAAKVNSYTYVQSIDPSKSSGKVFNKPVYSYIYNKRNFEIASHNTALLNENTCAYYAQNSNSNLPLTGSQNGNVMYTEVQKYTETDNGLNEGYIQNKYSFAQDLKLYQSYPFTQPTSYEWMSGHLLQSELYGKNLEGYHLKKRTRNTYNYNFTANNQALYPSEDGSHLTPPSQPNESHAVGLNISVLRPEYVLSSPTLTQNIYPAQFLIESYKLISSWVYQAQSIEENFESNGQILVDTVSYTYLNPLHAQLSKTTRKNSKDIQLISFTSYPLDYGPGTVWLDQLKNNHLINVAIENVLVHANANGAKIISAEVREFKPGGKPFLDNVFSLENEVPTVNSLYKFTNQVTGQLPASFTNSAYLKDSALKPKYASLRYDRFGNLIGFEELSGLKNSYIWSYKGQHPIAEIKNADYTIVESLLGTGAINNMLYQSPNKIAVDAFVAPIKLNLPNSHVSTYTFKPLIGINSQTDFKGMTVYYDYDEFNRLKLIRDQNGNILKGFEYNFKN